MEVLFFQLVISSMRFLGKRYDFSMNGRNALAFASVVRIRRFLIRAMAIFAIRAIRCSFAPKLVAVLCVPHDYVRRRLDFLIDRL